METNIVYRLDEVLRTQKISLALMTLPGMGVTSALKYLEKRVDRTVHFIWVDQDDVMQLWENIYGIRNSGKRFILHGLSIRALQKVFGEKELVNEEIAKTNLPDFFRKNADQIGNDYYFFVIDNFGKLPKDLARIILDETKLLNDNRADSMYSPIRKVYYIISGPINIEKIYNSDSHQVSVNSPATNFLKFKPYDFILSSEEVYKLVEDEFPAISGHELYRELIAEWAGGYLYYVIQFAKWVDENHFKYKNSQDLILELSSSIQDGKSGNIFRYCDAAWEVIEKNVIMLELLAKAVSVGLVSTTKNEAILLTQMGLLMQKSSKAEFFPPNRLVEFYLRQKLSEKGFVIPIHDAASWEVKSINIEAYIILLDVENRLRNFIADTIYSRHNFRTIWDVLTKIQSNVDKKENNGSRSGRMINEAQKRCEEEQKSPFLLGDTIDPILTYLDFGDLKQIIESNSESFPTILSNNLPTFMEEMIDFRRRVAHNRPITLAQLQNIRNRWLQIQKIMSR